MLSPVLEGGIDGDGIAGEFDMETRMGIYIYMYVCMCM
jgi:hypothetical protein